MVKDTDVTQLSSGQKLTLALKFKPQPSPEWIQFYDFQLLTNAASATWLRWEFISLHGDRSHNADVSMKTSLRWRIITVSLTHPVFLNNWGA